MRLLRCVLFALPLFVASSLALAGHDRDHDRKHARGHDRHGWQDRRDHGHGYERGYRYDYREPRYVVVRHRDRDYRRWERGHRYGGPIYVVHDYHHYRLRPPPRGYGWVRGGGNDYLLVALATGIILDVALR